jgi:plastocyanin
LRNAGEIRVQGPIACAGRNETWGGTLIPKGNRKRRSLVALALAGSAALLLSTGSSAEGPTVESAGPGSSGYYWSPSETTVGVGGSVTLRSTSTVVPHGVRWTGGPEKPSCSGVPVEQEEIDWSGDCTFAQAGSYAFVCTVHPTEMKGTISVSAGAPPPALPQAPAAAPESPLQGPASTALRLARRQAGISVLGSIALSPASAGGKLEVLLLTKGALKTAARPARTRVGRLLRFPLRVGRVAFAVPLEGRARRALSSRGKLSLTVQVTVRAPGQPALTLKRGVVLDD